MTTNEITLFKPASQPTVEAFTLHYVARSQVNGSTTNQTVASLAVFRHGSKFTVGRQDLPLEDFDLARETEEFLNRTAQTIGPESIVDGQVFIETTRALIPRDIGKSSVPFHKLQIRYEVDGDGWRTRRALLW